MRFYDPSTDPPEQLDSATLFPKCEDIDATQRCLKLGLLPSVTSVLSVIRQEYLERWKMSEAIKNYRRHGNAWLAVDEHYSLDSKESAFGTQVHEIIHQFATGKPMGNGKPLEHALPAIKWLRENVQDFLISEGTVACNQTGAAGTIDLAFTNKAGEEIIGDLKVVKIRKDYPTIPPLGYRCQLSAYNQMLKVKTGIDRKRLSLYLASPFGDQPNPRLLIFPYKNDYYPKFQACLALWHSQYGFDYEEVQNIIPAAPPSHFDPLAFKRP